MVFPGMSNLIVLLIAVGTAFPAGWLLCRAWTNASKTDGDSISRDKHHAMLQAQRSRYRRQVQRVAELVRRHEAARDQLRDKLAAIDEQTEERRGGEVHRLDRVRSPRADGCIEFGCTSPWWIHLDTCRWLTCQFDSRTIRGTKPAFTRSYNLTPDSVVQAPVMDGTVACLRTSSDGRKREELCQHTKALTTLPTPCR